MTRHTSPLVGLTHFADLFIPCRRNRPNTFRRLQCFGICELHLGGPYSTGNVHPVITRRPLQGLPWVDRSIHLFLLSAKELGSSNRGITISFLPFTFLLRSLPVYRLRRLDKVVFGKSHGAKDALVGLDNLVSNLPDSTTTPLFLPLTLEDSCR